MLVLALLVAAVDPGSLVPEAADFALVAEHAGPAAEEALALLTAAGENAPILRPASLGGAYEKGLAVNPFDPAVLKAIGAAPDAPLAVGTLGTSEFLTFGIGDAATTRSRLEAWLATQGNEVAQVRLKAGTVFRSKRGEQVVAAYLLRGNRALIARARMPGGDPVAAIDTMVSAPSLAKSKAWKAMPRSAAPWRLWLRSMGAGPLVANLSRTDGDRFQASGRIFVNSPAILATGSAQVPIPRAPGVLGAFRLRISEKASKAGGPLSDGIAALARNACPRCGPDVVKRVADGLATLVAGPAYLVLDGIDLKALAKGKLDAKALPLLYAVPVRDASLATTRVADLAKNLGAAAAEDGSWSVPGLEGGRLFFGVTQGLLYVATDPGARERGLGALAAGAGIPADAPFAGFLDAAVLGQKLASVSALDALSGGAMAGIFAAKLEVGTFLRQAAPVYVGARTDGPDVFVFDLSWDLKK